MMQFFYTERSRERIDLDEVEIYEKGWQKVSRDAFAFRFRDVYLICFRMKSGAYETWSFGEDEAERDRVFDKLELRMGPIKL